MSSELRMGIVGKRGQGFINGLRSLADVRVVAFCDASPEILQSVGDRYEIPERYRDYDEMIERDLDAVIVATPVLGFALYTFTAVQWSYSTGDHAGTLQKFSRQGWLCKTWEGELMQPTAPGVAPTIWHFTVRNDSTATLVMAGLGKHIVLHYREHRGVPTSCFGDTQFWVDSIQIEP